MSLHEILSPEHYSSFQRILEVRRADGSVAVTAEDAAAAILQSLVTESGTFSRECSERLGEFPSIPLGRSGVVSMIAAALAGEEPIPEAWIEAVAAGSFDLFKPLTYGAKDSVKGAPGVFLPRMLANIQSLSNGSVSREAHAKVCRTELAILCTVMLVKQLQKATCAKLALGPSFTVMAAVDQLPRAAQRQIDSLASNEAYRDELQSSISAVTARFANEARAERTNLEVQTTVPAGVDVEAFLSQRETKRVERVATMLVDAVKSRLDPGGQSDPCSGSMEVAANSVIAAVKKASSSIDVKREVDAATAYLRSVDVVSASDLAMHRKRLQVMMPYLRFAITATEETRTLASEVHSRAFCSSWLNGELFGSKDLNRIHAKIADRIEDYAEHVGPPPPKVPLEHLRLFEQAIVNICTKNVLFPARSEWLDAGLFPKINYVRKDIDLIKVVKYRGLRAIDVDVY